MKWKAENQLSIFDILESSVESEPPAPASNRITELTTKYLRHFVEQREQMDDEEVQEFLEYNESDPNVPYRERRIKELQKHIQQAEKAKSAQQQQEAAWMKSAREYVELTKKWESLGAFHVSEEYFTKWYYNGEEFYKWSGMPSAEEGLAKAKEADKRLMEIVNAESAHYSKVKNPDMRYLEAKHFDDSITNPNFVSYLLANGKQPGDPYRLSEAQKWIDIQVAAFKRANGRSEHDMLNEIEDWPSKLRIYLRNIAKSNG